MDRENHDKNYRGVKAWPADVQHFLEQHAQSFDQTVPWFDAFESLLLGGDALDYVQILDETSKPLAIMPVHNARLRLYPYISGMALMAPSNYYTGLVSPVVSRRLNEDEHRRLASEFIHRARDFSAIDLNPVEEDGAFTKALSTELRKQNWLSENYLRFGNWIEPIEARSFAEYMRDRPTRLKSTLQRKARRFSSIEHARMRVVTQHADVGRAMQEYEAVYRLSWKQDEPHKDFIRHIACEFSKRGWLRLGLATIDDRAIAGQIWFVFKGSAYIFKLAHDPNYSHLSVGSLLTAHLMQHVIDSDRVSIVDFLSGDDAYKADWMSLRRQRIGIRAVKSRTLFGAVERVRRVSRRVSKIAKRAWR